MLTNLWLLNLFLIVHILLILALGSLSWLYLDLFFQAKTKINLAKALRSILLTISLGLELTEAINGLTNSSNIFISIFLLLGLVLWLISNTWEPIAPVPPILPVSTPDGITLLPESSKKLAISPLVLVLAPFSFVIVGMICIQFYRKITVGLSKHYRPFFGYWIALGLYLLIQNITQLSINRFSFIEILTEPYSIGWIISQLLLLAAAVLLFRWIFVFISFRITTKIFLYIWQLTITLSVILASIYSIFTINAAESQVFDLLSKNAHLLNYSINQIKTNNQDILAVLTADQKLKDVMAIKNGSAIQNMVESFLHNNSYIDQVIVTDKAGLLIYDSNKPQEQGASLTGNILIKKAMLESSNEADFVDETTNADLTIVNYQFSYPVYDNNKRLLGVVTTIKSFNNNFLDYLKQQTQQELVIYVNGKRSASTILEVDGISRVENLPFQKSTVNYTQVTTQPVDNIEFAKINILTTSYYAAIQSLKTNQGDISADIVIATPQSLLIAATEKALINTFLVAMVISVLATIPSFYLAKSLKEI